MKLSRLIEIKIYKQPNVEETGMWMYKTYFLNGREYFSYDRLGMTGAAGTQKDFLYLESLLQFLEMDHTEWEPQLQHASESVEQFLKTGDVSCSTAVQMALGELAGQHVYFQLPYLKWSELLTRITVFGEDVPGTCGMYGM